MSRVFVIADTHFGHKRITEMGRGQFRDVAEHDAELVERWNSTVNKRDVVFHLGDVLFGVDAFATLAKLRGIKKLAMGNHDAYPATRYLEHFTKVASCFQVDGCILTHIPVHPYQLEKRYRMNVHGHMHTFKLDDSRYACVSADQTDFRPILLSAVTARAPA